MLDRRLGEHVVQVHDLIAAFITDQHKYSTVTEGHAVLLISRLSHCRTHELSRNSILNNIIS